MRKPNFFLVGQPKSGTSAIHRFLGEHPEIFMSRPKEPHFFCPDFHAITDEFHGSRAPAFHEVRDLDTYLGLFEPAGDEKILGEASTHYLYSGVAAERIHEFNPDARILIMLREPVAFLHSLHAEFLNNETEDEPDFGRALELEEHRRRGRHLPRTARCPAYLYYSARVGYAEQVRRYRSQFSADRVKIVVFDDLKEDVGAVYGEILDFLEVDPDFRPELSTVRGSRVPRSRFLNRFARRPVFRRIFRKLLPARTYDRLQSRVQSALFRTRPRDPVPQDLAARLCDRFRPEVERISELLGRDLVQEWGYERAPDTPR
jgi:hypothetical protein